MKFTPRKYQHTAIKFLLQHNAAFLALDPGLGKTSSVLAAMNLIRKVNPGEKALVIAPLRVCYQVWSAIGEIGKWDEFKHLRVALLHGKDKDESINTDADIYVINYDGLPWLCSAQGIGNQPRIAKLIARGCKTLVLDELSKFKHPRTKRCKLLKPWLPKFTRRWGLTGSPAANGLMDLFGECYMLDLGKALGQYITHYRMKYFVPGGFKGYEWKIAPGAEARIYEAIKPLALSMRATDHLQDLPDLVEENIWVDLPDEAREFYDTLEEELIAELEGELVVVQNAAVVSGKCRQISSGGLYHTMQGGSIVSKVVHHAKTEALVDLVDELQGAPLFIGYEFKHDLERIREKLGKIPAINGDTGPAETARIIKEWNEGKIPLLAAHPQAAGHGLNMQSAGCAHICWYTMPWDRELSDQFVARVWRQGNKASSVVVHRILARKTVDEAVARALGMKGKVQDALFAALKDYCKEKKR